MEGVYPYFIILGCVICLFDVSSEVSVFVFLSVFIIFVRQKFVFVFLRCFIACFLALFGGVNWSCHLHLERRVQFLFETVICSGLAWALSM
ncbi:hypothetical protein CW304_23320 [Bacillus sp. UFRGS-B20]|nr:hypothetical protein CW304_23320 [Bacillus sp. UFRGS-B20]